jgi:hypothetical protein
VQDVLAGALAGLLLAGTGAWFAARIAARHEAAEKVKDGRWDVWTTWAVGVLVRLFLLGALTWVLWLWCDRFVMSMLILVSVYLAGLLIETAWLYRRLITDTQGKKHG